MDVCWVRDLEQLHHVGFPGSTLRSHIAITRNGCFLFNPPKKIGLVYGIENTQDHQPLPSGTLVHFGGQIGRKSRCEMPNGCGLW